MSGPGECVKLSRFCGKGRERERKKSKFEKKNEKEGEKERYNVSRKKSLLVKGLFILGGDNTKHDIKTFTNGAYNVKPQITLNVPFLTGKNGQQQQQQYGPR